MSDAAPARGYRLSAFPLAALAAIGHRRQIADSRWPMTACGPCRAAPSNSPSASMIVPRSRTFSILALVILAAPLAAQEKSRDRPQPLDTVRVSVAARTGDAARETRSVTVVTRADIARTAARSLSDVLAPALGVDLRARSLASADVALRGASAEGVVILVDGVRVSDQQSGHFDLDLAVPLEAVERIEILRGTSSALYGADAVGGVIDIVTRTPVENGLASLAASGGSFGTATLAATLAGELAGARLTGAEDAARSDGHRAGTDYRVTQGRASALRAAGAGVLRVDAGLGVRHFGAADFYGAYPSFEDTRTATAAARWTGTLGAGWSLAAGADTRRHGDLFTLVRDDPALYQNRHVSWQTGANVVARRAVSDRLSLALGGDASDLALRSARLGDRDLRRGALFSEMTVGHAGGATLDGGLRVDWSSVDGTFASPTLAAALPLGGAIALRASATRGFRAPTWTERYYQDPANIGDPDLRVERFWSGELGLRATPSPRATFDAALFVRDARDLIDWAKPLAASDSAPWRTMNVAHARFRGAEGEATVRGIAGGDWTLRASALAFDAAAAEGYRGKYALSPITRSISLATTHTAGRARVSVDAGLARRAAEPTHETVNARLAFPAPRGAALTLDLFNLTDADYRDVSGAPIAGRAAYLGVRWYAGDRR
jgi:iron complex outermembrane receptor protein